MCGNTFRNKPRNIEFIVKNTHMHTCLFKCMLIECTFMTFISCGFLYYVNDTAAILKTVIKTGRKAPQFLQSPVVTKTYAPT